MGAHLLHNLWVFPRPFHSPLERPYIFLHSVQHAAAIQGVILDRKEAHGMCPVFEQSPLGEQLVQPFRWIITQATPQYQIRAACYYTDRVDLQKAHTTYRLENIGFACWLLRKMVKT